MVAPVLPHMLQYLALWDVFQFGHFAIGACLCLCESKLLWTCDVWHVATSNNSLGGVHASGVFSDQHSQVGIYGRKFSCGVLFGVDRNSLAVVFSGSG